ncbi:MAG: peptidylprolyl isomerase [Clostridiales bacterium]|nr:peptidylprolyl isomerase [Clostridiales bacterium]
MARIREQLLIQYAVNKAVAGAKVTDEEAKAFFDENPEQFVGQETVAASHILVDSEEKANEILGKIKAGEMTFEAAAAEFSSCPSSQNGGSLGEFGHGQMVPEFDQACFSMEVGAISEPVKTQFGYHIIRLDEKNEAKPIPYEDIAEQIKQHMLSEKQRQALQSKINQLKILFPVER